MKKIMLMTAAAVMAFSAGTSFAATAQQGKMATCSKQAAAQMLTGEARKSFMSSCLKSAAVPAAAAEKPAVAKKAEDMRAAAKKKAEAAAPAKAATAQQSKMGTCSKEAAAKGLSGDARKAFMSSCLKGSASAAATKAAAPKAGTRLTKDGKPMTAQQQKMADCAAAGKGLKRDAFRAHMSSCLKK